MPRLEEATAALGAIAAGKTPQEVESATLDFKEQGRSEGDTLKTIADAALCFANSSGGVVVVGVVCVRARARSGRRVRSRAAVSGCPETSDQGDCRRERAPARARRDSAAEALTLGFVKIPPPNGQNPPAQQVGVPVVVET